MSFTPFSTSFTVYYYNYFSSFSSSSSSCYYSYHNYSSKPDTELLKMNSCTEKFTFDPKEGIDNPLMVHTEESTARPRLCVLKKEEGESFGFHLRLEWTQRGHIIRNVLSGGVAARCGLQDGDRLLEVNNVYVDDIPHPEVAKRIRLSGQQLCLLVLDGQEYEKACGHNLHHLVRAHKSPDPKPPRLCHIVKDPASGLGINFIPVGAEKGCFSVNVLPGGAAEKSGVQNGDRLLWLNGATVFHLTHTALSRMMKKCTSITVLVMDSESEKKYSKLKMPILPCMAVPHKLPYSSRKLHLLSGPEGYGFLLRFEKAPSGRTSHVLRKVDAGSPAEKAGMRDGEVLLEVNGESVELLQHDDIVKKVRESKHTSLTTITPQGQEFYTQADASGQGLGAVLSQRVEGVDRPVLYISRKLSDREERYSTVERECLAIQWAVGAIRYYLLGRAFSLCSDHKPLQLLHHMKDANARITRWYLALQPHNFRVVHIWPWPTSFLAQLCGGGNGRGWTNARPEAGGGGMWGGAWSTRSLRAGCVQGPAMKQLTDEWIISAGTGYLNHCSFISSVGDHEEGRTRMRHRLWESG
ncbi:NHERF family PDZ scaffold protein 4b isoform X2 [Nerophis ophidion]|uniref:NHERF family PDZ scaffold protein 4b isoform X2 n=1 Tax=Nerophis ophidion TaxID=159077 RepID=UPI002AE04092|nr:NHERF family PDZ scaffold protein 4b isoform X2 [Nerophis ophidion]